MELSIIITNYKNPELLRLCLNSIKENYSKTDYELIVSDSETEKDMEMMMREDFPEVLFVPSNKNIGFGKAVNRGYKKSQGDYLLILNGDTLIKKDSVEILLTYIKNNPTVGVVGPQLLGFNEKFQPSCFRFYTPLTIIYRRTFLGKFSFARKHLDWFSMREFDHKDIRDVGWLMGSALMTKRSAVEKVGLLDENFWLYFEDTDWCRRFWENNYRIVYNPQAQIYHYHGKGSAGKGVLRTLLSNKLAWAHIFSAVYYFKKYAGKKIINQKNSMEKIEIVSEKELEKNRKIFKRASLAFLFILVGMLSYFVGLNNGKKNIQVNGNSNTALDQAVMVNKFSANNENVDFTLFWKVWDLVKVKYINRNKLNAQDMVYGAISGMLKSTGDPYTSFFDPKENKAFSQDIDGSFEGIGAELGIKDNLLTIIAPLDGSPAQKAGLRAGDKIIKIDDKIVSDMTVDESVALIRGKKGTTVKLTILSQGEKDTRDILIVRDTIEVKSVKLTFEDNNIARIAITKFGENTNTEFNVAAKTVISKHANGLIIDLRNDPGGLLDKAIAIASKLIPNGKVVVSEEDSFGKKTDFKTTGGDTLSQIPTVVLINEGSASASEILAGALRDDQQLSLIGVKSFGKGTVQELINLPGNSSVKITVAKWLTPNGDYIMEKGITPDVEVKITADDYKNNKDPQLDKALEVLKTKLK
jgi:carboxyl-terminal processing protease